MTIKTPYADLLPPLSDEEFESLQSNIEANGVQQPILVDEDGNILDGHHRYRINPDAPQRVIPGLSEASKRATAISANLSRRQLNGEQKAALRSVQKEIALQLKMEGQTQAKIAGALGVTQQAVQKWFNGITKTTSCNGDTPSTADHADEAPTDVDGSPALDTPPPDNRKKLSDEDKAEIVQRVAAGEPQTQVGNAYGISQSLVSKLVRNAGSNDGSKSTANGARAGCYINVPDGETAEIICRRGMDLEGEGLSAVEAAKRLGIGARTYRQMRDIVALVDRDDLPARDAEVAASALLLMNESNRITSSYDAIQSIVERIWGRGAGGTRAALESHRAEKFETGVGVIVQACFEAEGLDIPQLSAERASHLITEIGQCEKRLKALRNRLKEIYG